MVNYKKKYLKYKQKYLMNQMGGSTMKGGTNIALDIVTQISQLDKDIKKTIQKPCPCL